MLAVTCAAVAVVAVHAVFTRVNLVTERNRLSWLVVLLHTHTHEEAVQSIQKA